MFLFIPYVGYVGIILAIVGIVLGALARKKGENVGMATAGMVCSIIAAAINLVVWLACAVFVSAVSSNINELNDLISNIP